MQLLKLGMRRLCRWVLFYRMEQNDLQAVLDHQLYDNLMVSANIRDQACLTALSHSSGTSSGWLKA